MFDERTIQQLAQAIASRILPQIEKGNSHGGKGVPKRLLTVKDAAAYLGR